MQQNVVANILFKKRRSENPIEDGQECEGFCRERMWSTTQIRWLQLCGVVWCGVVWCGVVWCGVVWCVVWGGVWCGVMWYGVV